MPSPSERGWPSVSLSHSERRGGAAPYRRREGEYVRPDSELRIVSWEQAREVSVSSDADFSLVPCFWAGVRGAHLVDGSLWNRPRGVEHEVWGELVPEPFNPHDHNAVAVDVDGIRVGYMGRRSAEHAHRHVSAFNCGGQRVMVPVRFCVVPSPRDSGLQVNALAAFPTFQTYESYLPDAEESRAILTPLWEALDTPVRSKIGEDGFHLTKSTLAEIVRLCHLAPRSGVGAGTQLHAVPRALDLFLQGERARHGAERDRLQRERIQAQGERCKALHEEGLTNGEIANRESISPQTVAKRLRAAGVPPLKRASATQSQQIRALHRRGLPPAQIAERTGLGVAAVRRVVG